MSGASPFRPLPNASRHDLRVAPVEIDVTELGVGGRRHADVAGRADVEIELVVGADGQELPAVRLVFGEIIVDDDRHPSRVALQQSGVLTVTTSPNFAGKWLVHRLGRFVEAQADIEALLRTRPNGIAPPTARSTSPNSRRYRRSRRSRTISIIRPSRAPYWRDTYVASTLRD